MVAEILSSLPHSLSTEFIIYSWFTLSDLGSRPTRKTDHGRDKRPDRTYYCIFSVLYGIYTRTSTTGYSLVIYPHNAALQATSNSMLQSAKQTITPRGTVFSVTDDRLDCTMSESMHAPFSWGYAIISLPGIEGEESEHKTNSICAARRRTFAPNAWPQGPKGSCWQSPKVLDNGRHCAYYTICRSSLLLVIVI